MNEENKSKACCCPDHERNCGLLPIYALFIITFGLAALGKMTFTVPDWFLKQFAETILNLFPGSLEASFYMIALGETITTLLFLVSLFKREFKKDETGRVFLKAGLQMAMIMFVILGFGLRLVHDFNGAANLFFYFTGTVVCLIYVKMK